LIEQGKNVRIPPSFGLIPLLLAIALIPGCGKKDETAAKAKAATQVAAKVNADEITVHQVNYILARNPNVKPEAAGDAKREILDRLIDQQLAKQEAIEAKLDRSPDTMQAVEAARSEILARAYLERIAATQPRPTEEEVKKYYAEHPELFARRRVFSLEEILVAPQEGLAAGLREQVAKSRSMQDVAGWLKSRDAKFAVNSGVRAAEQIPLELLPKLQAMKDGAIQLFEAGDGRVDVIRIVASKPAPVDEATAMPRIQQFLFNQRSREAVAREMKRIKDKAKIAYVGEFAGGAAVAEAKAKAEAEAKARALAEGKAKEKAEAEARAEELSRARKAAEAKAQLEAEDRAAELARARREAEAKARVEAEAKARETPSKPAQLPQETIEKGLRGLK
jgi:EpsD family peptidyl-prolyl cis-trans isomerase